MSRMTAHPPRSSRSRVQRYRQSLRDRGMRPIQIWVPDTRAPNFAEEARRQCAAVNKVDRRDGIMDWLEDVSLFDEPDAAR